MTSLNKKLPSISGTRGTHNTPAVPPWFSPVQGKHLRIVGGHPSDDDPRALDNVWQIRLSYLFRLLHALNFQIAAPEGFSARLSAPAHTIPGVAVRKPGVLVSIVAIKRSIGLNYAINYRIGQFV